MYDGEACPVDRPLHTKPSIIAWYSPHHRKSSLRQIVALLPRPLVFKINAKLAFANNRNIDLKVGDHK